jgi:hypothetical protein
VSIHSMKSSWCDLASPVQFANGLIGSVSADTTLNRRVFVSPLLQSLINLI